MHCVRGRRNEGAHGATSLRQVHYLSPARVLAVRLCSGWQGGLDWRHGWRAPAHARTELAAMDARKARRWVRMLPPRRAGYTSLCAAGWLQPFQQPGARSGLPRLMRWCRGTDACVRAMVVLPAAAMCARRAEYTSAWLAGRRQLASSLQTIGASIRIGAGVLPAPMLACLQCLRLNFSGYRGRWHGDVCTRGALPCAGSGGAGDAALRLLGVTETHTRGVSLGVRHECERWSKAMRVSAAPMEGGG